VSGVAYQLQVQIPRTEMTSLEEIKNIPVTSKDGPTVLLRNIASISNGTAIAQYHRYNMQRTVTLTADIAGSDFQRLNEARRKAPDLVAPLTVDTARSKHEMAAANFKRNETLLAYTKIVAPFAGVIAASIAAGLYVLHNVLYDTISMVSGWLADRFQRAIAGRRLFPGRAHGTGGDVPANECLDPRRHLHCRRHLCGDGQVWRAVWIGLLGGLLAAVEDVFRLPFVFAKEWGIESIVPPAKFFKVFPRFGAGDGARRTD